MEMRRLIFIILVTVMPLMTVAQTETSVDSVQNDSGVAPSQKDSPWNYRYRVGVRMGLHLADMVYSHNPVDRYSHSMLPSPMVGLSTSVHLGDGGFSMWPEVSMVQRGVALQWLDVDYQLKADYLDFRLPLVYSFRLSDKSWSPYLLAGPTLGLAYGGRIDYSAFDYPDGVSRDITDADLAMADMGLLLGVGLDWMSKIGKLPLLLSLEAVYNMGLSNTFSYREVQGRSGSDAPSVIGNPFFGAELWQGNRYSRGMELAFRVSIPLGRFKLDTVVPVVMYVKQTDTVRVVDTVVEMIEAPLKMVAATPMKEYQIKDCYSVAEMFSFLTLNIDISDKRICLFDIKFDFDSYKLRPESYAPLNDVLMLMNSRPDVKIVVYGHTDSIGTNEYNQTLSENRANSVKEYLTSHGIEESRISAVGYGEEYPMTSNETEEGRFKNRRVEFDIILNTILQTR